MRITTLTMTSVVLLAVFATLSGCGGGGGGTPGVNVAGTVLDDSTLSPLQGATVQIGGTSSTPTGADGRFTIPNVDVGTKQMNVFLSGYQTLNGNVQVVAGGTDLGNLYLPEIASPGKGHVTGTILETFDASTGRLNDPVGGALIVAGGRTAHSKADGTFAIYNITPGQTSVVAEYALKLARANISVPTDATASVTLRLTVSPPTAPAL